MIDCVQSGSENERNKLKCIFLIFILASLLVSFGYFAGYSSKNDKPVSYIPKNSTGLLSQRVYSGILKEKTPLIFNLKPLQELLTRQIEQNNINVSLYVENLRNDISFGIKENIEFDPFSLNKLPIAIIILRKVELGQLSLNDQIEIKEEYANIKEGNLYTKVGQSFSIKELLHYMLSESDNTATFALKSKINFEDIQVISNYFNYYNPTPFEEGPSPNRNLFLVSPSSVQRVFEALYLSSFLNAEHSEYILSELTKTSFDIKKFANLPDDVTVAQKYGEYYETGSTYFHSCGIMYIKSSRIFYCIMTRDLDHDSAQKEVGWIVNSIYQFIMQTEQAN